MLNHEMEEILNNVYKSNKKKSLKTHLLGLLAHKEVPKDIQSKFKKYFLTQKFDYYE